MTILQDIQQLNAGNIITLYDLDLSECIGKYGQSPKIAIGNATVGSISSNSTGYTATLTGITSTSGLDIGTRLVSFTAGTGKLYQGTPTKCVITSVINETSITYKSFGGTTPTAGTITNLQAVEAFTWCDGVNALGDGIVFDSLLYRRYPIQASGFDKIGNGSIPRPKLTISNIGGIIGSLTREYNDLVGAKLTRTRTFARYLDTVNFKKFNYLLYSNNLQNSAWVIYKTGTGNGTYTIVSDPVYGSVLRITKTAGATSDRVGISQSISGLSGSYYNAFSYVRKGTTTATGYAMYVDAAKTAGGISTITAQITSTNTQINTWKQLSAVSENYPLSGTANAYMWVDGPIGSYIDFAWPQVAIGSILTEYQPTGANWNPTADPTQILDKEVWTIDRKANENSIFMEWELTAPFDLMGVKLPRRQCIQNMCNWKYRGAECGYTGSNYYDINDNVTTLANDICGKRLSSCKKRFGATAILPYGGFPAVGI